MMWKESVISKIYRKNKRGNLKISHSKYKVLKALAGFHGKSGNIFPSYSLLSDVTDCHPNTVYNSIKKLEEYGYISVTRTQKNGYSFKSNQYEINVPMMIDELNLPEAELKDLLKMTGTATEYFSYKNNILHEGGVHKNCEGGSQKLCTNKLINNYITIEREGEPASLSHAPTFSPIEDLADLDRYELMNPVETLEKELNFVIQDKCSTENIASKEIYRKDKSLIINNKSSETLHKTITHHEDNASIIKHIVPIDFQPTDENKTKAINFNLDIAKELPKFINYYQATERKERHWDKIFNAWLDKAAEWSKSVFIKESQHLKYEVKSTVPLWFSPDKKTVKTEKSFEALAMARKSWRNNPATFDQ